MRAANHGSCEKNANVCVSSKGKASKPAGKWLFLCMGVTRSLCFNVRHIGNSCLEPLCEKNIYINLLHFTLRHQSGGKYRPHIPCLCGLSVHAYVCFSVC